MGYSERYWHPGSNSRLVDRSPFLWYKSTKAEKERVRDTPEYRELRKVRG